MEAELPKNQVLLRPGDRLAVGIDGSCQPPTQNVRQLRALVSRCRSGKAIEGPQHVLATKVRVAQGALEPQERGNVIAEPARVDARHRGTASPTARSR
jgi:hypothetical protein